MNSSKKESIAVTAVTNEVNQYDNLEEHFNKRDREPVWDGDIYLYQGVSNKKSEMVGRIPVQIKGRDSSYVVKDYIYYNVDIKDIKNYRKDKKGTIFFIVEVYPNRSTNIYYRVFNLKLIDDVLTDIKEGQKTKRIKFDLLKQDKLSSICIDFIRELGTGQEIIPIEKVEVYDKKVTCYDYNTKYELEEMKKQDAVFYETKAYREAKEKLDKQNIIVIHGEPWVGKTSTARRLVMDYIEQGYLFIYGNVDDLTEIKNKVAMDEKIICLLDDFLGSNITYLEKNIAESTLDRIINIFKNSNEKKLILTTRTYIYNNSKELFKKFYHATSIKDEYLIEVTSYDYLEKGNILYNHLQKNGIIGTGHFMSIIYDKFYDTIIRNENFNPGVIALICERMKNKEILDVREYIEEALEDPEQLWEEEYKKLNIYEKMVLTIIVLFGVKVQECFVQEQFNQIIEMEQIKLIEEDTFSKCIDMLSNCFVKVSFDDSGDRILDVCKHSVADYIISEIKQKKIAIERYIESAKYVEVLHYIDILFLEDEYIKEQLASKVERDYYEIENFYYGKTSILYNILVQRLNPKRERILKNYIKFAFENCNTVFIIDILENENDPLYEYTVELFKRYVFNTNDEDYIYQLNSIFDCEIFFKTCLRLVKYKKNSDYAMNNLLDIKEMLIDVVTLDVQNTIEEIVLEDVARDIIARKKLEDVIKEHIYATVNDEIPSLRKLYGKEVYKEILDTLYEFHYIEVDEEQLQEAIEEVKNRKEEEEPWEEKDSSGIDLEQVKQIEEKFECEFYGQEHQIRQYNSIPTDLILKTYNKWWLSSFLDKYYRDYRSCQLYLEFIKEKPQADESLVGLGNEFLDYLFHEKNSISEEVEKKITQIAYKNFLKGNLYISEKDIEKYEKKYADFMKKIYEIEIIIKKEEGYCFLNDYLYLYLAIKEVIKKNKNLIFIMIDWQDDSHMLLDRKQEILQLYSELNTIQFNQNYVIPILQEFIELIEKQCSDIEKVNVSMTILNIICLKVELNLEFDVISTLNRQFVFLWIISFIINTDICWDIGRFDYSIYQKELYEKCYNEQQNIYELDFEKILKDEELKEICLKLKVWDYLYDIYKRCENILEMLEKDPKINVYHIAQKRVKEK